ncbi:hypothetical protein [Maribacter algicola]|uniref:hypothetical protein n=1 Tax=Maribacter algicola TaxID=2498892 RepID=UPI000F64C186|nr:hypothetical protein [Maribacter algicola]
MGCVVNPEGLGVGAKEIALQPIPMQSETAWGMRAKDCLDFKYPKISLAFLDTFSATEKVSYT